jgi:type II secretory pathway pseudopilin PulG
MPNERVFLRHHKPRQRHAQGFSLVELAMVLFIISLVVGGLLVPMATQLEARQRNDTQARLEEIREALIGYALINGKLPCPSTTVDPTDEDDSDGFAYGVEDLNCNVPPAAGYLPWKTLGVSAYDSWGVARTLSTDPMNGYWRYIVNTEFACPEDVCDGTERIKLSTGFISEVLSIEDANGAVLSSTSEPPVTIIYSTGADLTPNMENSTNEVSTPFIYQGGTFTPNFDDITIWLTRPLLFSRMVTAGTLP